MRAIRAGAGDALLRDDEDIVIDDVPDHDQTSLREQRWLLAAIREDQNLSRHWADAVNSLRIVLAADESIRSGRVVEFVKR